MTNSQHRRRAKRRDVLAKQVSKRLKASKLGATAIAAAAGITKVQAYSLLRGTAVPHLDTALSLATMLDITVDELVSV